MSDGNGPVFACSLIALILAAPVSAVAQSKAPTLVDFQPKAAISGTVRVAGPRPTAGLVARWEAAFQRLYPDVVFENAFKGATNAQYGLEEGVSDLAVMDRNIAPVEALAIYRRTQGYQVNVQVAQASYDEPNAAEPLVVFVNKANPITAITQHQITRVFRARFFGERRLVDGGVQWSVDDNHEGRGLGSNYIYINTWGEIGVGGDWADRAIVPYGPPLASPGGLSILHTCCGDMWNDRLREYQDPKEMIKALERDPYGIARTGIRYATPNVKILAVQGADPDAAAVDRPPLPPGIHVAPDAPRGAPRPTPMSVPVNPTFPISISFIPASPGGSGGLSPAAAEFLRYILSRQGQAIAAQEPSFKAASVAVANKSLRTMDVVPPRRPLETSSAVIPRLNDTIDGMSHSYELMPKEMPKE